MKPLEYTSHFEKLYRRLPPNIQQKVNKKLKILAKDHQDPALSSKKMVNQENIWEARIDYHYRLTFEVKTTFIQLRKVGTHEIYRNP